jgi:4-hydroxybenzoate polyprenyltransferase
MMSLRAWLREIRPHQWAKNLLIFIPAMAAHLAWTRAQVLDLLAGFAAFSLLASAVYVVNDLVDLPNDRLHATKRNRPIAAGLISPPAAIIGAALLVVTAAIITWQLPPEFQITLLVYLAITTAYSFVLKRRVLLDVICLASLYTIRVVAGSTLVEAPLSQWFLAFSIFFFFSLALVKRVAELRPLVSAEERAIAGRGYVAPDLPTLTSLGTAASMASSLVYCLYITSAEVTLLYRHPSLLWMGLPLFLYWQARVWLLTSRGRMDDDPVVFALKDRMSYLIALGFLVTIWLAT